MADLDFKHNVQEIPRGESLPEIKRSVGAEVISTPNVQGTISNYGQNTNWMSEIGSQVAAKSSTAIATKLGGDSGKNPHGDLPPSFTNFDKAFQDSYNTQAASTLGLQAQTLISKTNLELAAMPRLNGGTVAKAQVQVSQGLNKIFDLAPSSIRPEMEHQYGSVMLSQNEQLMRRMNDEDKLDRQNNLDISTKLNAQNIHSVAFSGVGLDKKGDSLPALSIIKSTEKAWKSAVAMRDKTPLEAEVAISTAYTTYYSGKYSRLADIAQSNGKLHEFERSLADSPPDDIPEKYRDAVYQNVISHINNQQALRTQDQTLETQIMYNRIVADPTSISDTDLSAFQQKVTPLEYEQTIFRLLQARNKKSTDNTKINFLKANYADPRVQANMTPELKNQAFNDFVMQQMKKDPTLSIDDAEVMVASAAGAPSPVFTKTLQNGLWSGDPQQMMAKARQIEDLQMSYNGHALTDLSPSDLAIASDILHNANPMDPTWSTRMVAENRMNQDEAVRKNSESALASHIYANTIKNNTTPNDWILGKFGLSDGMFSTKFDSPWLKGKYAADILSEYSTNFINTRGDEVRTKFLTEEYIKNNYGETMFNGQSEWTKHPIEKACGFEKGQGINVINKDIIRQLSKPMVEQKQLYDDKKSDSYWTIEPIATTKSSDSLKVAGTLINAVSKTVVGGIVENVLSKDQIEPSDRLQFVKHSRNGVSTDIVKYPLKLVGNNFNWELNVNTDHGIMSIFLADPTIGVYKYTPDIKWIQDEYLGNSHVDMTDKYNASLKNKLSDGLTNG